MNEFDIEWMEQRLRKALAGRQPTAPRRLIDFVDTVPVTNRRAGRIELALERPLVRRSFFALAAAAAVIVAVVGSAVLVSYRQLPAAASQWPSANLSDGWAWQATDGTLYLAALAVPKGFVATCGRESGREMVDMTLCSSPDGLHWSIPADPSIVSVEGGGTFLPDYLLVRDGVYLASSTATSGEHQDPARRLWRSTDGVHWSMVDVSSSLGTASILPTVVVPDGFLASASWNYPGAPGEELVISPDGLTWSKAGDWPFDIPVTGGPSMIPTLDGLGLYVAVTRPGGTDTGVWRTTDGRHWDAVTLPAGFDQLGTLVTLPDGSLRAVVSTFNGSTPNVIVRSTDGLAWHLDPVDPAGSVDAIMVVGDRMVAWVSAAANYTDPQTVWQSDDWGKTWRPLHDLAGRPLSGSVRPLGGGGRLEVIGTDYTVHWLLTPVKGGAPAASPSQTSDASPGAEASASSAASPSESASESATSGASIAPPAAVPSPTAG